jgi:glycosyltransferase involved in cell wall biosynthesis
LSRSALLLSTHPPGGHSGPGIRGLATLDALRGCCEHVDAVSLATPAERDKVAPGVQLVDRPDAPSRWAFLVAVARDGSSFVPERHGRLPERIRELVAAGSLLPRYDVVWAHFALMAGPGLAVEARGRVLDVDTVWGASRRRAAARAGGSPLQRAYRRLDAAAVARGERARCNRYDHVVVASVDEAQRLGGVRVPVGVVPNSVPAPAMPPPVAGLRRDLLFVGRLDHEANVDAVRFLLDDVLPILRRRRGDVTLTIAGRTASGGLLKACEAAGARLIADAPSLEPLYADARAVVAPLRLGGGTHVKLIEAMARGLPVVASPVAAEGLALTDGVDVIIASDPEAFAGRCAQLLDDPGLADRIGGAARASWHERYRPEIVRRSIAELVERLAPRL